MKVAAILLLAGPALAQEGGQSREALLTALAANECSVAEDEVARVFGPHGFDPEFVRRELGRMVLDEVAFLEGGRVLRVFARHCPPAQPLPTPAQTLRRAIEDNDCRIDDLSAFGTGMGEAQVRAVAEAWLASGAARVEGRELVLTECG